MSDQQKLDGIASALNAGHWTEAQRLALELAAACDQRGVLTLRPLELWPLLNAIASLSDELEEGGVERVMVEEDDDEDDDDDAGELEDDDDDESEPEASW
jgi:hypothetical protein